MAIAAGTGHSVAAITPARRVAVRLLRDQRVRDGRSRELLRSSDALSALDERDRALATRLVLGVVASRGALDAAIDSHLRPHSHLEPKVRDALRLASFELMYLDTPPSAAVSQGVELVRLASRRAAALANAVLRRVAERDAPSAAAARARVVADDCSLEDLALTAALPIWLVRALVASRGESFARQLALSLADPAPVYVVGNAAREDATVTRALLSAAGLGPLPTGLPASFELAHPSGLARSDLVGGVRAVPADLASQLVALIAAPAPGGSLLEVGQGRATKTILLQGAALRGERRQTSSRSNLRPESCASPESASHARGFLTTAAASPSTRGACPTTTSPQSCAVPSGACSWMPPARARARCAAIRRSPGRLIRLPPWARYPPCNCRSCRRLPPASLSGAASSTRPARPSCRRTSPWSGPSLPARRARASRSFPWPRHQVCRMPGPRPRGWSQNP